MLQNLPKNVTIYLCWIIQSGYDITQTHTHTHAKIHSQTHIIQHNKFMSYGVFFFNFFILFILFFQIVFPKTQKVLRNCETGKKTQQKQQSLDKFSRYSEFRPPFLANGGIQFLGKVLFINENNININKNTNINNNNNNKQQKNNIFPTNHHIISTLQLITHLSPHRVFSTFISNALIYRVTYLLFCVLRFAFCVLRFAFSVCAYVLCLTENKNKTKKKSTNPA